MNEPQPKFQIQADFINMDSKAASKYISQALDFINQLEWHSNQVDQNTYDDLNNRYSDGPTTSERLKLIANQFDTDDFLLSIIDQLRDTINDSNNTKQLFSITLGSSNQPLTDNEIQDLVPKHEITLHKVAGADAQFVAKKVQMLLDQFHNQS